MTARRGSSRSELRETAIVLGASISGLLATRVLADFYSRVIVVERDILPDRPTTRRGVPQGGFPHIPQARATQIMGELLPGFLDDLVAGGGRVWNDGDLSRVWMSYGGHLLLRSGAIPEPESIVTYYVTRPFLEWNLYRRMFAIPNVKILGGHYVASLTSTPGRDRVTGVVLRDDRGAETSLEADLVVDATGRGSRTPVFLEGLGYRRPREAQLRVRIAYAGLTLHVPPGMLRENIAVAGPRPSLPMGFAMFAGENDTYVLGVQTVAGREPPTDRASLLAALADVAPQHVVAAARHGDPLTDIAHYRFPANRWRRYDKLERMPADLIVVGDAMCSFNPLYGQGMSVAAIEAVILRQCLEQSRRNLPRRFFRSSAREIGMAWQSAVGSDLTLPQISGRRPVSMRMTHAYMDKVLAAAETDPAVAQQFLRLISMIDLPSQMMRPAMIGRVIKGARAVPAPNDPRNKSFRLYIAGLRWKKDADGAQ